MENYQLAGAAVLSYDNIETTDNLIASAIKSLPKSAVTAVMPVVKTKGPTSQWVEPFYKDDKFELLSVPVNMFTEHNKRKSLRLSCNAVQDLVRMYTPESLDAIVQSWIMFHKNKQQRDELVEILQSPEVSLPAEHQVTLGNEEDIFEILQDRIYQVIAKIKTDYQLGDTHFSVVGPNGVLYAASRMQYYNDKIHVMTDDRLKKVYVFPTGDGAMTRAGIGLFEYADEYQRTHDSTTGDLCYWIYNRSNIVVNPCHKENPIIRNIDLV